MPAHTTISIYIYIYAYFYIYTTYIFKETHPKHIYILPPMMCMRKGTSRRSRFDYLQHHRMEGKQSTRPDRCVDFCKWWCLYICLYMLLGVRFRIKGGAPSHAAFEQRQSPLTLGGGWGHHPFVAQPSRIRSIRSRWMDKRTEREEGVGEWYGRRGPRI